MLKRQSTTSLDQTSLTERFLFSSLVSQRPRASRLKMERPLNESDLLVEVVVAEAADVVVVLLVDVA